MFDTVVDTIASRIEAGIQRVKNLQSGVADLLTGGATALDFAGMNQQNLEQFESALRNYQDAVQKIINDFHPDAPMSLALKGDAAVAVQEFLVQIQKLLVTYVESLNHERTMLEEAAEAYVAGAKAIAGGIETQTSAAEAVTDAISLD